MANKTMRYIITWAYREDGNRKIEDHWEGTATSVPRAISKFVKEMNTEDGAMTEPENRLKAADYFILDVRSVTFDRAVQEHRETTA